MVLIGCLVLVLWLGVLPICVGGLFAGRKNEYSSSAAFRFMAGTMFLWAIFQLVCVPCVILQKSFSLVVAIYLGLGIMAGVTGCLVGRKVPRNAPERKAFAKVEKTGWMVFTILFLLQMVCAVALTYADGDDAYYVAVSEITNDSNTMYEKSPYSVGYTELDIRHGLAPFPIWIAFLSRISGIHTVVMSKVVIAAYLIAMSYVGFYLVGKQLFHNKKEYVPVFLSAMALLVLFGDYSTRTPENFMIARSRQGKAAMGSIIIPMLLFLLLVILKQVQELKKSGFAMWLLLACTITAACLCTTLGTFLACTMVGIVGVCVLLVYKKILPVVKMALCCVPAVVFALLYFVLG